MKVELCGGPLDGAVLEVPPQTTIVTVDRRHSLHASKAKTMCERTYTIQFDNRKPLRALYVDLYPGDLVEE